MRETDKACDRIEPSYISALYSIWTVQDSLLQYYRTMFITAQSLLIAVSATIASSTQSSKGQLSLLLIIGGLLLLGVWIIVTWSRARDVQFVQELLKSSENGSRVDFPFSTFKEYQNSWRIRSAYTIAYRGGHSESFAPRCVWPPTDVPVWCFWRWGTRIHMEVTLPTIYLFGWVVVAIYACGA